MPLLKRCIYNYVTLGKYTITFFDLRKVKNSLATTIKINKYNRGCMMMEIKQSGSKACYFISQKMSKYNNMFKCHYKCFTIVDCTGERLANVEILALFFCHISQI